MGRPTIAALRRRLATLDRDMADRRCALRVIEIVFSNDHPVYRREATALERMEQQHATLRTIIQRATR